jgi:hypothetical protein
MLHTKVFGGRASGAATVRRTLLTLAVASGVAGWSGVGMASAAASSSAAAVPASVAASGAAASVTTASVAAASVATAPEPAAPSSADVAAARSAANATLDTVGRFLAAGGRQPHGSVQQREAAAAALAPRLDSATVPVYYLDAAFVADPWAAGTATPVAKLAFLATDAVGTSGAHASVWAAKVGAAWKVVNIAQGSDETAYAAQTRPGGTVFEEPQIGAWYQLLGGRVLPLDDAARQSVGAQGLSLAAYHQLVRSRYADKLPGSAYDRAGLAGGFQPRNPALAAGSGTGSGSGSDADGIALLAGGGAAVALAGLGGAGFVVYRRNRRNQRAEEVVTA